MILFSSFIKSYHIKIFSVIVLPVIILTGFSGNTSLKFKKSIPLNNVSGRIDHLSVNLRENIVYVAALGNNSVEIVNLKKGEVIHSIKNLDEPQGILYIPESHSIFISNGGNGECDVYNADTFEKSHSLKLAGDADNVRYDPAGRKIYVGYGNGGIAIIDVGTFKILNEIKLEGHPESFQLDKDANRIYVNVPGKKQIEIIDLKKNKVIAKWKMTEAASNFPMALDKADHLLFIGCRHPAKMLVIDTSTGKTIKTVSIDGDVDDIFYNNQEKEIYITCGAGYMDILKQINPKTYNSEAKIPTRSGARTSLYVPDLNQLIVAVPARYSAEASLLIFEVN